MVNEPLGGYKETRRQLLEYCELTPRYGWEETTAGVKLSFRENFGKFIFKKLGFSKSENVAQGIIYLQSPKEVFKGIRRGVLQGGSHGMILYQF